MKCFTLTNVAEIRSLPTKYAETEVLLLTNVAEIAKNRTKLEKWFLGVFDSSRVVYSSKLQMHNVM